ncbi:Palmitoyltransferase [Pseudozyma hubeiensis]|nr:Palmitoyltransferase [Pseudozyma hubeiensis]
MLPVDDSDAPSKNASAPSSPESNKVRSTLSPSGEHGSTTSSKARSSSSPSSGDHNSLSAPRSAASADSRSSEAVEVVPWQVATTDSDGVRKSEEIFRPLSLIQSRRGSSNTVIPGILPSAADSTGSQTSTIRKMPPTPLKGVSGREWASRSSHEDVNMDSDMFSTLTGEGIGLVMTIYQSLFFIFEAPYWWITFSPALPLAAAALFLLSDGLIIQLLLQRRSNGHLLLCSLTVSVLSLLYCVVLSVWITMRLIRSPDKGASAPGIHFDRSRDTVVDGSAAQEVLRDMPMPVVLAGVGIIGVVVDAGAAMWLWWRRSGCRHGDVEGW